jgi:polysaccharide deacetylase family protein (PEP-CTERM system associated)
MNNALSFDVEDWFQVENLKSAIPRESWDGCELRVEANTNRILRMLRDSGVRATFFILGWVAERCPDLVRAIAQEGHEVASHGYGHGLVYDMSVESFREDLLRSKRILEDIIRKPVIGYRAPSFSITPETLWALDVLKDAGFKYDSSVFPVSFHDRYGFAGCDTRPFAWPNGLVEIPLAVYEVGRFRWPAAGGGYFRLFPYGYFRRVFAKLNGRNEPFTFYLHPWEFDPGQPRVRVPWFYRFRHYVNLGKTEGRLRRLLKDFRFSTIPDAYREQLANGAVRGRRRTKVTMMIDRIDSNLGGTENQLLKLTRGLDPKLLDVRLIGLHETEWFREHRGEFRCPTDVIEFNNFRHPLTYLNFFRLVNLLRRMRPDVVHTFFPAANIFGVMAARLAGVQGIVSSRRDYGEWMSTRYLLATRFANRFVGRIVANSNQVKELTERKEKVDGKRIEVIYNGIDINLFSRVPCDEALKQKLDIAAGDKVIGIVANFRPMKRHTTFIHAAGEILQKRRDVCFVLIGEDASIPGLKDSVKKLAQSLGIHDRMRFVDAQGQHDVLRYLSIMDVGVNCSEGEGLSNAVMEYMTFGVPCVVSGSGGNPDLVTGEVHGAVFALEDHHALATQILRMLDSPELRQRFAVNARTRIETEMSLPAMLLNYQRFYQEMAETRA